jgi:hypothetical protein
MPFELPRKFADRVNGVARALTDYEGEPNPGKQAESLQRAFKLACMALRSLDLDQMRKEAVKVFSVAVSIHPQWPETTLRDLTEFRRFLDAFESTTMERVGIDDNARARIVRECQRVRPFVLALLGEVHGDPVQLAQMGEAGIIALRVDICRELDMLENSRLRLNTARANKRKMRWLDKVLSSACGPINLMTPIPDPVIYGVWSATSAAIGLLGGWYMDYPDD